MSSTNRPSSKLEAALHDAQSALPGVIVGSLLLGVFTLLIAFSAYILKHKGLRKRPYAIMLFAVVHMYSCALIYWAVTVYSLLQAVVDPEGYALLDAYSAGVRSRVTLACLGLNFWFSDFIVVWRIWALWADSRKMWCIRALSCTLVLGVVVGGLTDFIQDLTITVDLSYPTDGQGRYYNEPSPFYASAAGEVAALFSGVLNIWCVALAFVKLWQIRCLQAIIGHHVRDSRAGRLLIILCFSGLAYCAFWVYWVVTSAINQGPGLNQTLLLCNNAAAVQINGIYPTFVITSLSLQQANTTDDHLLPTAVLSSVVDPLVRSQSTQQFPSRQGSLMSMMTLASNT
ncbi:unnamed protein product [Peniophora sp. CBMAI 1063]|nr:unnamed protein product [Peniophora sp. CBMAI 1063]